MEKNGLRKTLLTKQTRRGIRWIFFYVALAFFLCSLLFPLYWMVLTSLRPDGRVMSYPPDFLPTGGGFHAYQRVFSRTLVSRWFLNSIIVTAATLGLSIPLSCLAGYALSRYQIARVRVLGYILLLAKMLPATLLVIPLYALFKQFGLLNNLFGLVIANTTFVLPFSTWMLKGFFDGIPKDLEQAAQIDGCGILESFVRVIVPLSLPGLAATAVYAAVLAWGEYMFAVTFMTKESGWTASVGVVSFMGQYIVSWNDIMAACIVFTLPVMAVFAILQKYLVSGLTKGGVKG